MTRSTSDNDRRKELLELAQKPNGLEVVMNLYQELVGIFPPANLTPREIIDAIIWTEKDNQRAG